MTAPSSLETGVLSAPLPPVVRTSELWLQRLWVACAGLLYAIALKYFVLPSRVVLTGTEGIATALGYYFESFDLFIGLYLAFQLVLLVFAALKMSRTFVVRTAIVVGTVVAGLTLLPDLTFAQPEPHNERMVLVLFGGILAGAAKAIAMKQRGSTGDEDIVAAYLATRYLKPVGSIIVAAAVISTAVGLGLDWLKTGEFEPVVNTLMYTCIYIFASSETLNNLYKRFRLTMLTIVTLDVAAVGNAIFSCSQHRTYTVQDGVGGRTAERYGMVRTILTHEELVEVLRAVEEAEPTCFYFHHDIEGVSRRYYIPPIG